MMYGSKKGKKKQVETAIKTSAIPCKRLYTTDAA
jgi:hypothetical protein